MSLRHTLPFIALILILAVFSYTAYAQENRITAKTDKVEYKTGDTIMISGIVSKLQSSHQVVIQVYNPENVLSRMDPVDVSADGSFSYAYAIAGPLNQISGEYRIVVTYGWTSDELSFLYTSLEPRWQSYVVQVDGKSYVVRYSIQGGSVQRIAIDPELATLTTTIISDSQGKLIMQIPRLLVNFGSIIPIPGGSDIEFEVFIDGIPDVVEPANIQCHKQVTIQFEAGAEEIELIWPTYYPDEIRRSVPYQTTVPIQGFNALFELKAKMNADNCYFSFASGKRQLSVDLDGPSNSQGYFEITLPHRFLGGNYTVL
ncbi:MAG: hypothetical protein MN733_05415, partial [Nitrososphaera sp.]|nr:hypothetical protein [Nitrososphaera sp.]